MLAGSDNQGMPRYVPHLGRAVVAVAAAVSVAACGTGQRKTATVVPPVAATVNDCATRSQAAFPHAYTDPGNLVVGPAVIVGGSEAGRTDPAMVRPAGPGWKMPVLVLAGRRVTIRIRPPGRLDARLDYQSATPAQPLRELPYEVTFIACKPNERSGSDADGRPVTFWSGGFQFRKLPICVPLEFGIDGRRQVRWSLSLGKGGCPP
jgi:hypothetical protein